MTAHTTVVPPLPPMPPSPNCLTPHFLFSSQLLLVLFQLASSNPLSFQVQTSCLESHSATGKRLRGA